MERRYIMEVYSCVSCGENLFGTNFVKLPCPSCGEAVYRCKRCRKLSNSYKCGNCGFIGP
ncbi:MAG: zinc finger domain-containing protein [Archaeoglobaceae archaeon]